MNQDHWISVIQDKETDLEELLALLKLGYSLVCRGERCGNSGIAFIKQVML